MSNAGDSDPSQLSSSQQDALEQYTQLTNQEPKDAISLLQRSQWNVQVAITKFFDGEGPDPVAEALAAQDRIPQDSPRHENLQESLLAGSARPSRRDRTELAPRIVPHHVVSYRPPLLLSILFAPLQVGYRVLSTLFRSLMYLFSFLPQSLRPRAVTSSIARGLKSTSGRKMLRPRDTAARFKREFDEEYGEHSLPFFEGGVAEAQDLAKKELKFLLIILMSPEHDDTQSFVRETLLAPEVVSYINDPANNVILWGGNVLDSEAYQVSIEYSCTKFPFTAVVCLTPKEGSTRMGIAKRLVGPMTPQAYLTNIQNTIAKYAPDLDGVRAERAAQEVARNLRSEQDTAYERSLAKDRERARQRREAEAASAAAEKKEKEKEEAAAIREQKGQQWKKWRAATIGPEPEASNKDVVRVALKMPESTGTGRIVRRFQKETTIEELYVFVECYDALQDAAEPSDEKVAEPDDYEHQYKFRIASVMPREVYEPTDSSTMGDKIGRSGNLIVEEVSYDSDDE